MSYGVRMRVELVAGIALSMVALAAPAGASPARAVARGRAEGGRCVFADDVRVPAGYVARVDARCALRTEPVADASDVHPGADQMAKRTGADAGTVAGTGSETVSRLAVPLVPTDLTRPGYRAKLGFSELWVFDEYHRLEYRDTMTYAFQRRVSDGAIAAAEPYQGQCVTGNSLAAGVDPNAIPPSAGDVVGAASQAVTSTAPYDPYVLDCYSNLLTQTSSRLVFESGGWYGAIIGAYGIGKDFDFRQMGSQWTGNRSGFVADPSVSFCFLGGAMPRPPGGEWIYQCVQRESDYVE